MERNLAPHRALYHPLWLVALGLLVVGVIGFGAGAAEDRDGRADRLQALSGFNELCHNSKNPPRLPRGEVLGRSARHHPGEFVFCSHYSCKE